MLEKPTPLQWPQILEALSWADDKVCGFSNEVPPWDSYDEVFVWLMHNIPSLLADRERGDANSRDLFRSGYLCGATESISDTRDGLEREANAAADAFMGFVAARIAAERPAAEETR